MRDDFETIFKRTANAIIDDRMKSQIRDRALVLLHAK